MLDALYRPFVSLAAQRNMVLGSIRPPQYNNVMAIQSPGGVSPGMRGFGDMSSVAGPIQANSMYGGGANSRSMLGLGLSNMGPSQVMKPELKETNPDYVEPPRANPQELSPFLQKTYKSTLSFTPRLPSLRALPLLLHVDHLHLVHARQSLQTSLHPTHVVSLLHRVLLHQGARHN